MIKTILIIFIVLLFIIVGVMPGCSGNTVKQLPVPENTNLENNGFTIIRNQADLNLFFVRNIPTMQPWQIDFSSYNVIFFKQTFPTPPLECKVSKIIVKGNTATITITFNGRTPLQVIEKVNIPFKVSKDITKIVFIIRDIKANKDFSTYTLEI